MGDSSHVDEIRRGRDSKLGTRSHVGGYESDRAGAALPEPEIEATNESRALALATRIPISLNPRQTCPTPE